MPLTVHQFPCLQDNYGFLIRDEATRRRPPASTRPDARAILRRARPPGLGPARLHPQHPLAPRPRRRQRGDQGGDRRDHRRAPRRSSASSPVDRLVGDGDVVMLGETRLRRHRHRRPHPGPHHLSRRRRPHRLRRRHPVRAGLRAAVRGHARADVRQPRPAEGPARGHPGLLRPRIHRRQRPLRAAASTTSPALARARRGRLRRPRARRVHRAHQHRPGDARPTPS